MNKKISIITPSLNQGKFIEETIISVLHQEYDNFEHIIIDGGSTDGTLDILERYSHIKWISEKDNGQSHAINKGFLIATGEILTWINSDDYFENNIFNMVNSKFNDINCNVLYGDITYIDENGNRLYTITGESLKMEKLIKNPDLMRQPGTFWRADILKKAGLLDQYLNVVMDFDLFIRMLKITQFKYYPQNFSYFRVHSAAKTQLLLRNQVLELYKVYFKNKLKIPFFTHKKLIGRYLNSYKFFEKIKSVVFPKGIYRNEEKYSDS